MVTKRNGFEGPEWWWGSADFVIITTFTVGVPSCTGGYTYRNPQSLCGPALNSWGIGSIGNQTRTNLVEGDLTTGQTIRKSTQGVITFADGHAKTMPPARIAAGTNFSPTQDQSATVINDISKYKWDAD